MKLQPLQDRVLVDRDDEEETTAGGIIIPEASRKKLTRGTVLAVGRGKVVDGHLRETVVKVGQRVVFGTYSGTELPDGQVIMTEEEIYGVIED